MQDSIFIPGSKPKAIYRPCNDNIEIPGLKSKNERIERLLYEALEENRFEVYYQPLYSVCDGKFTEAEALLRMRDKNGKFIPPDKFIPVAESTGLIVDIGFFVLKKVCNYIKYLQSCNIYVSAISVNISIAQLMRDDAVERFLDTIQRSGISPKYILFEITESVLICNYEKIADKIIRLSRSGIRFALDDFGTGYSNLTHVIDLPFNVVKLDKSLIWDSIKNQKCNIIIHDLTRAFKNVNLSVTAEGVETKEHDDFVRMCGCDKIQGFRYAKPMPLCEAMNYFIL